MTFPHNFQKDLEIASKALFLARRDLSLHMKSMKDQGGAHTVSEAQFFLDLELSVHRIESEIDALVSMVDAESKAGVET